MTKEEAIKYIKYCMCEGRLVGNTKPIIDEKWQAGVMAIEALEQESILDKIRAKIEKLEYLNIDDGSDGYDKYIEQYEVLKIIDKYNRK